MTNMAKGPNTRVIFLPTSQQGDSSITPLQASQWQQMGEQQQQQ